METSRLLIHFSEMLVFRGSLHDLWGFCMIFFAADKYDGSQESHSSRSLILIPCIMNIDT